MTNILIGGYYGAGNLGDEAILECMLKDFRTLRSDLVFFVTSWNPNQTSKQYKVNAIHWKDLPGLLDAGQKSSLIILGGGGIFQDYWGIDTDTYLRTSYRDITSYGSLPLLANLLGIPCMIYAVGLGPFKSTEALQHTRFAFENCQASTLRDSDSLGLLRKSGYFNDSSLPAPQVLADPVFTLVIDKNDDKIVEKLLLDNQINLQDNLIAVVLRHWDPDGIGLGWLENVATGLNKFLLENDSFQVILLSFQNNDLSPMTNDGAINKLFQKFDIQNKYHYFEEQISPRICQALIKRCDLVLGMRLHSLIMGINAGTPIVGIPYDPKITSLMTSAGMENYCINGFPPEKTDVAFKLGLAWKNRKQIPTIMGEFQELSKNAAKENTRIALDLLSEHPCLPRRFVQEFPIQQIRIINNLDNSLEITSRKNSELLSKLESNLFDLEKITIENKIIKNNLRMVLEKLEKAKRVKQILITENELHERELEKKLRERDNELTTLRTQLNQIYFSKFWKLASFYYSFVNITRTSKLSGITVRSNKKIQSNISHLKNSLKDFSLDLIKRFIRVPSIFQDYYYHQDNTTVILYSDNDLLWPTYPLRQKTGITKNSIKSLKVSLIVSVKNEEDNINVWFERICGQTLKPSEIIIADGGSTDGTLDLLKKQMNLWPIPIQILSNSGGNIAQGRNMAINQSSNEIIAVTDFGCLPANNWLEMILTPFIIDPEIVVSAGIYNPFYPENEPLYKKKLWLWGNLERISPENYLPPGGSAAFQKKVWREVGGYPEWLTLTGEDTFFDLELKQRGGKWAFVPGAIVNWYAPKKFIPYLEKLFNWAIGDGEMKFRGDFFWRYTTRNIVIIIGLLSILIYPFTSSLFLNGQYLNFYYLVILSLCYLGMRLWSRRNNSPSELILYRMLGGFSQFCGYLQGVRRQRRINIKRYEKTKGIVILLSGVPIDDTGGGARCTQIALEFLRRNFIVIYLYRFPKYESKNLNLNIAHPNLIVRSIREINYKYIIQSFQGLPQAKNLLAIIEHPIPDFLPVVDYINKLGGKTIYDKIDAWDTSIGGKWYSKKTEIKFINQSQILTTTVPLLSNHIKEITGRKVHLIPNAVNPVIFNPNMDFIIPKDMPCGTWRGIYIGALWGDWFDWTLLKKIAETYPDATFPIIGDFRGEDLSFPKNVHFLGLKKQTELPAYLKFSNVAFIPWKVDDITQATSPIKVYEFLAMRCPIVTPRLDPLNGIPGIYLAKDNEDFIASLDKVKDIKLDERILSPFIAANTWDKRIQQFLDLCQ